MFLLILRDQCHLVNAYEVEAGVVLFAGKTVWSMPERLKARL